MNTKQKQPKLKFILMFAVACGLPFSAQVYAQYPDRVVRLMVPGAPGGPSDILARKTADGLSKVWPHPVIVENRPGNGVIATDVAAKAPPDGYTLLLVNGATAINASLVAKLPYDTLRDLAPITQINSTAFALIVPVASPVTSVKALIERARANPGKLNYASSGIGSSLHLCAELFAINAGIQLVHVPYKGAAQPLADMYSGQIDLMFLGTTNVVPLVKAGKMRALAVTSPRRSVPLPDVPTLQESGMKDFNVVAWNGISAPAKTPRTLITKVHADAAKVINAPDFVAFLKATGSDPVANPPEQFDAFFREEVSKWATVIKSAGIKPE